MIFVRHGALVETSHTKGALAGPRGALATQHTSRPTRCMGLGREDVCVDVEEIVAVEHAHVYV